MSSFTAMASLHASPKTLFNPSITPSSPQSNTSSKTRSCTHQTHLLNRRTRVVFRAMASPNSRHHVNRKVVEKSGTDCFARITSATTSQETTSVSLSPQQSAPPPSPSQFGSPLFWIGVGVGFSALFSLVASNLKKYAMQQAFKAMTSQMNPQNNQFNNSAFSPSSPFPFPMPPTSGPATSPFPAASRTSVTVDVPMTNVEPRPAPTPASTSTVDAKDEADMKGPRTYAEKESSKYAFVDVSPEETNLKSPFESLTDVEEINSSKDAQPVGENGAASNQGQGSSQGAQPTRPPMSVEALEKMMEDPTVQKMVFP